MKKLVLAALIALATCGIATAAVPDNVITFAPSSMMNSTSSKQWNHYDVAVKLDKPEMVGCKVWGVMASLWNDQKKCPITFWTSTTLSGEPDGQKVTTTPADDGLWGYFAEGVEIPEDGLYVGFSFDVAEGNNASNYGTQTPSVGEGYNYVKNQDTGEWEDRSDKGTLFIKMKIEPRETMVQNSLKFETPETVITTLAGKPFSVPFRAYNGGLNQLIKFKYTYKVDGVQVPDTMVQTHNYFQKSQMWCTSNVGLTFNPIEEEGEHTIEFVPFEVGTAANECQDPVSFKVNVVKSGIIDFPEAALTSSIADNEAITMIKVDDYFNGQYQVAMKLQKPEFVGLKLIGAKVTHISDSTQVTDFAIWNSSTLGDTPDGEVVKVAREGNEIMAKFAVPKELTEDGVYVGFNETLAIMSNDNNVIPTSTPKEVANSLWIKAGKNKWNDVSKMGAATITVYLEGELADNAVRLNKMSGNTLFIADQPYTINFELQNTGQNEINEIGYTFKSGDVEKANTYTFEPAIPVGLGKITKVELPFEAMNERGSFDGTITIDKVNGQANAEKTNSTATTLTFARFLPVKRPIMEEGTGTGCGWCPRGVLAMDLMKKQFPEFIGAAYHTYDDKDPMNPGFSLPWLPDGYPTANISRTKEMDPFFGTNTKENFHIAVDYANDTLLAAPATINLATSYNADTKEIKVDATTKFVALENGKTYKLAYLLVADSITGTGSEWKQNNSYPTEGEYENHEYFNVLFNGEYDLSTYNHVVLSCSKPYGIDDALPETLEIEKENADSRTFSLDKNPLVDNADDVHVIAMVLDNTGSVRNARMVKVGETTTPDYEPEEVGITLTLNDNQRAQYFDLQGRRVNEPQNGLFIKRQGNKATKVIL